MALVQLLRLHVLNQLDMSPKKEIAMTITLLYTQVHLNYVTTLMTTVTDRLMKVFPKTFTLRTMTMMGTVPLRMERWHAPCLSVILPNLVIVMITIPMFILAHLSSVIILMMIVMDKLMTMFNNLHSTLIVTGMALGLQLQLLTVILLRVTL